MSIKQQVKDIKNIADEFIKTNEENIKLYGKIYIIKFEKDLEKINWKLLQEIPNEELLLLVSFNELNSRMEFEFIKLITNI
jgi:hypothetical protein